MNIKKSPKLQQSISFRSNKNISGSRLNFQGKDTSGGSRRILNRRSSHNLYNNSKSDDQSYFTAQSKNQNSFSILQDVADTPIQVDDLETSGMHTFSNDHIVTGNKKKLLEEFEQIKDEIISQNKNNISNIKFDNFISTLPQDNDQIDIIFQNKNTTSQNNRNKQNNHQNQYLSQKRQSMPLNAQNGRVQYNQGQDQQRLKFKNTNMNQYNNIKTSSNEKSTHRNSKQSLDPNKYQQKDKILQIKNLNAYDNVKNGIFHNNISEVQLYEKVKPEDQNQRTLSTLNEDLNQNCFNSPPINFEQKNYKDYSNQINENPYNNMVFQNKQTIQPASSQQVISQSLRQFQEDFAKFKSEFDCLNQNLIQGNGENTFVDGQDKAKCSRNMLIANKQSQNLTVQKIDAFQDSKQKNLNSMGNLINHHMVSTSTFGNVNEVYKLNGQNSQLKTQIQEEKISQVSETDYEQPPYNINNINSKQLSDSRYFKSLQTNNNCTMMQTINTLDENDQSTSIKKKKNDLKQKIFQQYKVSLQQLNHKKHKRHQSSFSHHMNEDKNNLAKLKNQSNNKRFNSTDFVYGNDDKLYSNKQSESSIKSRKQVCKHQKQKSINQKNVNSIEQNKQKRQLNIQKDQNQIKMKETNNEAKSNEEIFFNLVEHVFNLEQQFQNQQQNNKKSQISKIPKLKSKPSSFKEIALYLQDLLQFKMTQDIEQKSIQVSKQNSVKSFCQCCQQDEESQSFYEDQSSYSQQDSKLIDKQYYRQPKIQNSSIECQNCFILVKQIDQVNKFQEKSQQQLQKMQNDVFQKDQNIQSIKLQNLDLQQKVNTISQKLFEQNSRQQNISQNHENLLQKCADQQSDIHKLIFESKTIKNEKENLCKQIQWLKIDYKQQLDNYNLDIQELKQKNINQNQTIGDLQNKIIKSRLEFDQILKEKEQGILKLKSTNQLLVQKLDEFERQTNHKLDQVYLDIKQQFENDYSLKEQSIIQNKNQEIKLLQLEIRKLQLKIDSHESQQKSFASNYQSQNQLQKLELEQQYKEKIFQVELELKGTKLLEEQMQKQLQDEKNIRNKFQEELKHLQELIHELQGENSYLENENKFYRDKLTRLKNSEHDNSFQNEKKKNTGRRGQSVDYSKKYYQGFNEGESQRTLKVNLDDSQQLKDKKLYINKFQQISQQIQNDFQTFREEQDNQQNFNQEEIQMAESIYQDSYSQMLSQALIIEKFNKKVLKLQSNLEINKCQNCDKLQQQLSSYKKQNIKSVQKLSKEFDYDDQERNENIDNIQNKKKDLIKKNLNSQNKQKQNNLSLRQMWRQSQQEMRQKNQSLYGAQSVSCSEKNVQQVNSPQSQISRKYKQKNDDYETQIEILKATYSEEQNNILQKLKKSEYENQELISEIKDIKKQLVDYEDKDGKYYLRIKNELNSDVIQKQNEILNLKDENQRFKEQVKQQNQEITYRKEVEQKLMKLNEELRQMVKEERDLTKEEQESLNKQLLFQQSKFRAKIYLFINRLYVLAQVLKIQLPFFNFQKNNDKMFSVDDNQINKVDSEKEQIEAILECIINNVKVNSKLNQINNVNQMQQRISQSKATIDRNGNLNQSQVEILDQSDQKQQLNLQKVYINSKSSQMLFSQQQSQQKNLINQNNQNYLKSFEIDKTEQSLNESLQQEKNQNSKINQFKVLQKSVDQKRNFPKQRLQHESFENYLLLDNNENFKNKRSQKIQQHQSNKQLINKENNDDQIQQREFNIQNQKEVNVQSKNQNFENLKVNNYKQYKSQYYINQNDQHDKYSKNQSQTNENDRNLQNSQSLASEDQINCKKIRQKDHQNYETPNCNRLTIRQQKKAALSNQNTLNYPQMEIDCPTHIEEESKISKILNSCFIKRKTSNNNHYNQKSSRYLEVLSQSIDQDLQQDSINNYESQVQEINNQNINNDMEKYQSNQILKQSRSLRVIHQNSQSQQFQKYQNVEISKQSQLQKECAEFNQKLKQLKDKLESSNNSERRTDNDSFIQ